MSRRTLRFILGFAVIVVLLAAAWFTGWKITGKMNPLDWTKQAETEQGGGDDSDNGGNVEASNFVLGNVDESNGVSLMTTRAVAENSIIVEAIITPDNTTETDFHWSLRWKDGAAHGECADFVELTVLDSSAKRVKLTCLGKFLYTVELVCTSVETPSVYGVATVDYLARNLIINYGGYFDSGLDYSYKIFDFSEDGSSYFDGGSLKPLASFEHIDIKVNTDLITYMSGKGYTLPAEYRITTDRGTYTLREILNEIVSANNDGVNLENFWREFYFWAKPIASNPDDGFVRMFDLSLTVGYRYVNNGFSIGCGYISSEADSVYACGIYSNDVEALSVPVSDIGITTPDGGIVF